VVAVVVVLMAVATSGVAAASAPTGPERNVASGHCLAILRQESGTVMPAGWSDYRESDCSLTGGQSAGLATLDNLNNQWMGPETVSVALGQTATTSPLDNPNGQWIGPETVSAAQGQLQSYSVPTTGGSGDLTSGAATWRDAVAGDGGPGSPAVSTSRQMSYGPPGR